MKKTIMALVIACIMIFSSAGVFAEPVLISAPADVYGDIGGHWAREAINKVADKGIFSDANGNFQPNKAISRSEFAAMLHKALGIQIMYFKATDIADYYSDVKNDASYASALYDLVTANIIDYKGKFRPDEALPRQELVHYAINSLEYMTGGEYAMVMMMPAPFADASDINPAYSNDFVKAQILKLVLGRPDRKFYPEKSATRAEAAAIVYRLVNTLENLKVKEEVKVLPSAAVFENSLNLELVVANNTKKAVTINHSSGQKYDFAVLDENRKEIYRWSASRSFIQSLSETVIQPGESVSFNEKLQGEDYNTIKDKAVYVRAYITGASQDFTIETGGYETQIVK